MISIVDLKNNILNGNINDDAIIFKYDDNTWLVNQYINEICKITKKTKVFVENLDEVINLQNDIFGSENDSIYVYMVDKFEYDITRYNLKNVIVKTKEVTNTNSLERTVQFDKLLNSHIKAYCKLCLPGLKDNEIDWLCEICKYDINRLDMECKKISIFNKANQELVFKQINDENGYVDLNTLTIFNFTNAILKKDIKGVKEILDDIENIDVEPTGVVTVLYKNFKNIISIQMDSKATADSLGMKYNQFSAIKRNCGIYNNSDLIRIFELISDIDYKLKSGYIDNNDIVNYLVINIM